MYIWLAIDVDDQLASLRAAAQRVTDELYAGNPALTLPLHISLHTTPADSTNTTHTLPLCLHSTNDLSDENVPVHAKLPTDTILHFHTHLEESIF